MKNVLLILVDHRKETAVNVQKTLTAWGCLIKTRLGLHQGVQKDCTETGLIICELAGEESQIMELKRKIELIKGVSAELVTLKFKD
jgi:hypothetical protein